MLFVFTIGHKGEEETLTYKRKILKFYTKSISKILKYLNIVVNSIYFENETQKSINNIYFPKVT